MSDAVIIAIIGGAVSIIGIALGGFINYKVNKIQKQVNGHMDDIIKQAMEIGYQRGLHDGKILNKQ